MQPLFAFGLPQGPELIIIFLVVLLLFGANKLPGLARALGKSLGEFRKAKEDIEREIQRAAEEAEFKSRESTPPLPDTQARRDTATPSSSPTESSRQSTEEPR